ncbi:hypothetical protein N7G274_010156 [Stereocaulon virgatum]|uniref:Thyroglobulin type-1 domain-containing protein n=1 Tax=Stereocaulon virgatum TaxID=373712 RepID=A0ABR3ZUA6_9LECA
MLFPRAAALLLLPLVQLVATVPATLEDRETACIALGTCPGLNSPNAASLPATSPAPPTSITPAPAPPTPSPEPFGCYHGADPNGAQGFCPQVAATGWCICSDSSTYAITTGLPNGPCGYTTPPPSGPTTLPTTSCSGTGSPPSSTASSAPGRSLCSQKICPKFCDRGSTNAKRSFDLLSNIENGLKKRFYEDSDPDTFPYNLLSQSYTRNICPSDPPRNTYIWKPFTNRQSAGALQGLCGCTTIFVLSSKGAFSSHIYEEDLANEPPRDLQPANYQNTMTDLAAQLAPHADELAGGEAFIILPNDPENRNNRLYPPEIVAALQDTVQNAVNIAPQLITYVPEDFETSVVLGSNRLGTAMWQFDPKFEDGNSKVRAYRVFAESHLLSQKSGF